jgi:hypothetical protein
MNGCLDNYGSIDDLIEIKMVIQLKRGLPPSALSNRRRLQVYQDNAFVTTF